MTKAEILELVKVTMTASSCCPEAKAACADYLAAVGTEDEKTKAEILIAELKEDLTDIDACIDFLGTDFAKQIYGDSLDAVLAQSKAVKAAGEKYCVCPACQAGSKIVENADVLLG